MDRFFPKLYLDFSSFWAGALLVVVLVVVYLRYRKRINVSLARSLKNLIDFRESLSVSSEADYLQVLYKFTEGMHSAADFTPLSPILVPPYCIAPPPDFFPGKTSLDPSLVQQTLGYDPLLPELPAEYFGPRFPLHEAVRNHTSLCLVGYPGSGKSTAIAACIAKLIRNLKDDDASYRKIPFYIKAHDLLTQFPDSNLLGILVKAIQANKSFLTIPNFLNYLTNNIKSGNAVLFIDDMDLLTLTDLNRLVNFLTTLSDSLPDLQLVATASPTCLGNLPAAGLEMISISIWGDEEKYTYLANLSKCWPPQEPSSPQESPIQQAMLVVSDQFSTPLEFSLKCLAAYAGDIAGPTAAQAISSHIRRAFSGQEDLIKALEVISVYTLQSRKSTFTRREINAWVSDIYQRNATQDGGLRLPSFSVIIQAGIDSTILTASGPEEYYFSSPTVAGYLAARGLSGLSKDFILEILESPDWATMHETMRFFAIFNDIKPFLKNLMNDRSVMRDKVNRAAAWLPSLRYNSPEETALLKALTREIHSNPLYIIKLRLVCALARSSNTAVKSIFQHLQKSPSLTTRRAAAIGTGLIKDLSAVPFLISQLNDEFPSNTAACYALGRIESPHSLEAIAEALLNGTEHLRRAAAESLAQNRSEGHPALREGATRQDLLVRYAVVHGLSLVTEPWSLNILDKMRIDEKEWVVRDLAQSSYQVMKEGSPYLPQHIPPPEKAPWLLDFAAKGNFTAPGSENALEYLLKALETGTDDQKQNSIAYLARSGNPDVIPQLLKAAQGNRFDIAQQAELAAWYLAPPRYNFQN